MPGSTKKQIASRLRKAIVYAENLVSVLQDRTTSKASTSTALEAKAYLFMLKGTLDFEKSKWKSCIQNYSLVHMVYSVMSSETRTDIYKDLLSSIVDPSIRYASYQLKTPRTKPVRDIVLENFPAEEKSVREDLTDNDANAFEKDQESKQMKNGSKHAPTHISWRTRNVKLEDAAISQALGVAQERENTLEEQYTVYTKGDTDAATIAVAYDDIITARQDAADATKIAIDELAADGVDPSDSRIQSLQITRTAVNYGVIEWRVGRNPESFVAPKTVLRSNPRNTDNPPSLEKMASHAQLRSKARAANSRASASEQHFMKLSCKVLTPSKNSQV